MALGRLAGVAAVQRCRSGRTDPWTSCRTTVRPETWRDSLDDRLTAYETGADLDGYMWGVKWHSLYSGARVVADSARAQAWGKAVGIEFHEVSISTNAHELILVFSDLQISELEPGYTPWSLQ